MYQSEIPGFKLVGANSAPWNYLGSESVVSIPNPDIFNSIPGTTSDSYHAGWLRPNDKDRDLSIFYPDEFYAVNQELSPTQGKLDRFIWMVVIVFNIGVVGLFH